MKGRTRIIWTLWHQGYALAPPIVQQCIDSWRHHNPDYDVRILDESTLGRYTAIGERIDLKRKDITVQKISALCRLDLLHRHGGIWTDATVHCIRPLKDWLPDQDARESFFAFRNPGKDRLISNWFIASEPESPLLQRLHHDFVTFFSENTFANNATPFGKKVIECLAPMLDENPEATRKWLDPIFTKALQVYPYFIFHYIFNNIILEDAACRELWQRVPVWEATPAHLLQHLAKGGDPQRVSKAIRKRSSPVYKLNWRCDAASSYWTSVLAELKEQNPHSHDRRHSLEPQP